MRTERFALTQAKYLACRILQVFEEITAIDKLGNVLPIAANGSWVESARYDVGLTMSPHGGVWVRLIPAA